MATHSNILPKEFHGQRSLVGYSPWGHKELDMTERLTHSEASGFPGGTSGKELPVSAGDIRDTGFDSWVGRIPWRKAWQPTPVFLPGEFHGQRSLVGYSPWGHKESDMTD